MESLESRLKARAVELGFALSGIAPATDADGFDRFTAWLDRGFAGEMQYLHRLRQERRHPRSVMESVRSVLMVGLEYCPGEPSDVSRRVNDITRHLTVLGSPSGRVASYAAGPDYHRFIWDRLNALCDWLEAESPGGQMRALTRRLINVGRRLVGGHQRL